MSDPGFADAAAVRLEFRALGRRVRLAPGDLAAHRSRVAAALHMPGSEPVQGALADLMHAAREAPQAERQAALEAVRARLAPAVAQRAATAVADPGPTACSGLATRWSVLVSPSLNVPRRRLRCSADDSRALAGAAAAAFVAHDEPAQAEFLDHCTVCADVAAFMLARRAILRQGHVLPPPWLRVQDHFTRLAGCA